MAADRFFIAPYDQKSGLQTNVKPWLIPDEAFSKLQNAYVFRGRVRKRFGSRWFMDNPLLSRFRVPIAGGSGVGTTNGSGNATATVPGGAGAIGQWFSIGTKLFTVNATGTPANLLFATGAATTATFNTSTGVYAFTGAPALMQVYWYPGYPVMGLLTYETAVVDNPITIGFDTTYSYIYNGGWQLITLGANTWTGTDSDFFWGATYTDATASNTAFFVTNFKTADGIRYYQKSTSTWTQASFNYDGTNTVTTAAIIVVFKNRMLLFNTVENGMSYPNRCRFSRVGNVLDTDSWRQDIPGNGGAIDATTVESVSTVEFIKDRLIVYMTNSTWEIVYNGNQVYPFVWQQINTELGVEATFSVVPFDKVALGFGNLGIMACNGSNVERIDEKIPDQAFDVSNSNNGIYRIYGIRDYFVEQVYWTFPNTTPSSDSYYPNSVLVYNYRTGTWAINDDSITAFGYFYPQTGITWSNTEITWDDPVPWDSGELQTLFKQVVGGNQQGFTFICDPDQRTNAAVLQITDIDSGVEPILTIINHNLPLDSYIYIEGATYSDSSNGLNGQIFQVNDVIDEDTIEITPNATFTGTYTGGGLVARVSQIDIWTKEYNFYATEGRNAYISKVDFMVDKTGSGQMTVNFYDSSSTEPLLEQGLYEGVVLGTGSLDTFPYTALNAAYGVKAPINFEANQVRLWHPVFFFAEGEVVQFEITMSDAQMRSVPITQADFQMHALCIFATPTTERLQ